MNRDTAIDLLDRLHEAQNELCAGGSGAAFQLPRSPDGFATIRNVDHRWSAVGLYDVIDQHITACWLLRSTGTR